MTEAFRGRLAEEPRIRTITRHLVTAGDPRLAEFHRGIYWDAFSTQHEPLAVWERALAGELPYTLHVRLALEGDTIAGGIVYERYPQSGCGLVTYMVVSPAARRSGLGRALLTEAADELYASGAPAVFGEVNDPRLPGDAEAWPRLLRNQRWGARVLDARYIQPALAPGLDRDRGLVLIVLPPIPALTASTVWAFVRELYAVTEHGRPDPEVAIADPIRLTSLVPEHPVDPVDSPG